MYSCLQTRLRLTHSGIVERLLSVNVNVTGWQRVALIIVGVILTEVALALFVGLFCVLQYGNTFEVGVLKGVGAAAISIAPLPLAIWLVKRYNAKPKSSEVVVIGLITVLSIALSGAFNGFIYDWAGERFQYGATFGAMLPSVLAVVYFFALKKSSAT